MLRVFSTGDGAQGCVHVRKELYKLSYVPSPFSTHVCPLFLSFPTVPKLSLNLIEHQNDGEVVETALLGLLTFRVSNPEGQVGHKSLHLYQVPK